MNRFFKVLLILVMIIPVTPHMAIHATSDTMPDIQDTTRDLIEEFNDEYELLLEGEVDVLATHSSDSELEVETELIYEVNAEDSELQDDTYMYEIMHPAMKSSESCHVVTSGRFPNQTGVGGLRGAPWVLCADGVLEVGEGFINWTSLSSPWSAHSSQISRIVFTEPITAGTSLQGLFSQLWQVIEIEGLSYFDTSQVTNMSWMFESASNLVSLDLSSFDTSRVTNMSLMFSGMTSLRELTLGSQFIFRNSSWLPTITPTHILTGRWQNVGTGTLENPAGDFVFTSAQLMSQYNPQTMADTFVWQRWPENPQVIAEGQFENQAGANGLEGAPWRLYENRTLVVDAGFIESIGWSNPWHVHQSQISRIVFTGPIRVGASLRGLFSHMWQVTEIEGLGYFDTSLVEDMSGMFLGSTHLTSLDVSKFDTSNVTDMSGMFLGLSHLTSLDVSNFDTSNVTDMSGMFLGSTYLTSLDVSNFDTSNVTDMSGMFLGSSHLTSLDVSNFNTSNVTDMSGMFLRLSDLTSLDVSSFDTSNVADMSGMFLGLSRLSSLDVSNFDTSNVTDMSGMFFELSRLRRLDVSSFDTSNVIDMNRMFFGLSGLTSLDVSSFDTSSVTDMSGMFFELSRLTSLDVSSFDTSNVINMNRMFSRLLRLTSLDVSNFDTSNVTNMNSMFSNASVYDSDGLRSMDVLNFDTSNIANMSDMFASAYGLNGLTSLDVSNFDTSNVTDMSGMFLGLSHLTSLDVSSFDTSNVTNMNSMFSGLSHLKSLDVSNFDTNNVTNMSWMFSTMNMYGTFSVPSQLTSLDVSDFDTSNVTDMSGMFAGLSQLTNLDVSNFDTSNVTNMNSMFSNAEHLTSLDLSNWDTSRVTQWNMSSMFNNMTSLRVLTLGSQFQFRNSSGLSEVTPTHIFNGLWQNVGTGTLENPAGDFVFTSAQLMSQYNPQTMADTFVWQRWPENPQVIAEGQFENQAGANGLEGAPWRLYENRTLVVDAGFINWTGWTNPWNAHQSQISRIVFTGPITAGSSLRSLFGNMDSLIKIEGLSYFDTSQVTDMSNMFSSWSRNQLTTLDVSNWDTGQVRDMSSMFSNASRLSSLDVSNWNTSNVTNMSWMFSSVSNLSSLDVSNWDTGQVRDMSSMFSNASLLSSLDVSNWDTGQVRGMSSMFSNASRLTSLDVSNWDTGQVRDMSSMFSNASRLTSLDVSNWDTGQVRGMSSMFSNASRLTSLDLSSWNTSRVQNMSRMFSYVASLEALDLSSFDTSEVWNMSFMFAMSCAFAGERGQTNLDTRQMNDDRRSNLTSLDVSSFDTSRVNTMEGMFCGRSSLVSLDLSNFDTSNVRNMFKMFESTGLETLDLSSFDTSNLNEQEMNQMFARSYSLQTLTLGKDFEFISSPFYWSLSNPNLPEIDPTAEFTGYWQSIGDGTVSNPTGDFIFTSTQLMEQFDGNTMADTFVWQPVENDVTPRDALRELIAEAEARIQANYTPRSWGDMQSMLTFARSVYNNPNLQDAQYDEAVILLRARLDALVLR